VGNNPALGYNALLDEAQPFMSASVRCAPETPSLRPNPGQRFGAFRDYQPGAEPVNNDSLVLHVAYGATSVLLEGDAEAPIEQAMLAEPGLPAHC